MLDRPRSSQAPHDARLACLRLRLARAARAEINLVVTHGASSREAELNEVGRLDGNLSINRDIALDVLLPYIFLIIEHDLRVAWNVQRPRRRFDLCQRVLIIWGKKTCSATMYK